MITADTIRPTRLGARSLAAPVPHLDHAPITAAVSDEQAEAMDDMAEYACPHLPADAVTHFCVGEPQAYVPPARQRGLARAFLLWRICSLRFKLRSAQRYLDECERAGITAGRNIDEYCWQIEHMKAQLRALEGQR